MNDAEKTSASGTNRVYPFASTSRSCDTVLFAAVTSFRLRV